MIRSLPLSVLYPRPVLYLNSQSIARSQRLSRPQFFGFAFKIYAVPFEIKMREDYFAYLSQTSETHCLCQFEMFGRRLITPEGTFQYQQINAARECREAFVISCV